MFYNFTNDLSNFKYACRNMSFKQVGWQICPHCGRNVGEIQMSNEKPIFALEAESENLAYPDFLAFTGVSKEAFILSEKALSELLRAGISGLSEFERVEIVHESTAANICLAPTYYLANVGGRIDLDLGRMHLKKKRTCNVCGQFEWSRQHFGDAWLDESSWSEDDMCRLLSIPGFIICTDKVLDAIQKGSLTGAVIKNIQDIFRVNQAIKGVVR